MREEGIRKKAIEQLRKEGYVCWCPPKAKYYFETDIFGIYDLCAWGKKDVRMIQLTTTDHISHRRRKIVEKLALMGRLANCFRPWQSEVWGWHNKKRIFKKEIVA